MNQSPNPHFLLLADLTFLTNLHNKQLLRIDNKEISNGWITRYELEQKLNTYSNLEDFVHNKYPFIKSLLFDNSIEISFDLLYCIIQFSKNSDIIGIALDKITDISQLNSLYIFSYRYNKCLVFVKLMNMCKKRNMYFIEKHFNFMEGISYSIEYGFQELFNEMIEFINYLQQNTTKPIIEYNMLMQVALCKQQIFAFDVLIHNLFIDPYIHIDHLKHYINEIYYGWSFYISYMLNTLINSNKYVLNQLDMIYIIKNS